MEGLTRKGRSAAGRQAAEPRQGRHRRTMAMTSGLWRRTCGGNLELGEVGWLLRRQVRGGGLVAATSGSRRRDGSGEMCSGSRAEKGVSGADLRRSGVGGAAAEGRRGGAVAEGCDRGRGGETTAEEGGDLGLGGGLVV
jgi:hypothetical protein